MPVRARSPQVPNQVTKEADIIDKSIGSVSRWQIVTCVIICLVKFPVAWLQLSIVFLAPPVDFTCADNQSECSATCQQHIFDRTIFTETIITQWDLVCQRAYLSNLAQTVTMSGILVGNLLFGHFSDRFGRRNPFIFAVVLMVVCGTAAAFCPWFWAFLVMRFLAALATGGSMVMSFVLVMEIVGLKWRTTVGILYQIPFNLGHLTLPIFAYFIRDWRSFHVAISTPAILLISYYWVLPESPRWLLTVGHKERAIRVLEKAAEYNDNRLHSIRQDVDVYLDQRPHTKSNGSIVDLVRTPIMRVYTACIGYNWFVCGLCFFGSAQYIGQLDGNIFINVALSAVIQIPSTFFAIWSLKTFGRKRTLIFSNLLTGLSCISIGLAPAEPTWIRSALSSAAMFGLAVCFPTVYIYSGELFPTIVRNIGVGTSSMFARIGSMAAPFVAGLVGVKPWLPPLVFGAVPMLGAVLCLKLPETLDCQLPDSVEQAEGLSKKPTFT